MVDLNTRVPARLPLGPGMVLGVLKNLDEADRGALLKNLWPTLSDRHLVLMVRYPEEVKSDAGGLVLPASWGHESVAL